MCGDFNGSPHNKENSIYSLKFIIMIADIYNCPHCGINVYLSNDDEYCPICGSIERYNMPLIEAAVDLDADASKENPKYAHFGHLMALLEQQYGEKAGLYVKDCWDYAWDATKTDLENADGINAFLDSPNEYLARFKEPLDQAGLKEEVKRLLFLALSKATMPLDEYEMQKRLSSRTHLDPTIRIYVRHDLKEVKAAACYREGVSYPFTNFVPVEKDNLPPICLKRFREFNCPYWASFTTAKSRKKDLPKWVDNVATGIVKTMFPKPSWLERTIKRLKEKTQKQPEMTL